MKVNSTAADAVATMQKRDTYRSPGDPKVVNGSTMRKKFGEKQKTNSKVASAVANAVAEVTA